MPTITFANSYDPDPDEFNYLDCPECLKEVEPIVTDQGDNGVTGEWWVDWECPQCGTENGSIVRRK